MNNKINKKDPIHLIGISGKIGSGQQRFSRKNYTISYSKKK